jgi:hypothetical protein
MGRFGLGLTLGCVHPGDDHALNQSAARPLTGATILARFVRNWTDRVTSMSGVAHTRHIGSELEECDPRGRTTDFTTLQQT